MYCPRIMFCVDFANLLDRLRSFVFNISSFGQVKADSEKRRQENESKQKGAAGAALGNYGG